MLLMLVQLLYIPYVILADPETKHKRCYIVNSPSMPSNYFSLSTSWLHAPLLRANRMVFSQVSLSLLTNRHIYLLNSNNNATLNAMCIL